VAVSLPRAISSDLTLELTPEKSPIHASTATNISGKTFCGDNLTQFNLSRIKPYYLCQYRNQYISKQFQMTNQYFNCFLRALAGFE
jgi:hypothetical protein